MAALTLEGKRLSHAFGAVPSARQFITHFEVGIKLDSFLPFGLLNLRLLILIAIQTPASSKKMRLVNP